MAKNKKNFDEAIAELEVIVQKLERGELPLEEAMDMFQKGIELSKHCSKALDDAEKKIALLLEDENGEIREQSFATEA